MAESYDESSCSINTQQHLRKVDDDGNVALAQRQPSQKKEGGYHIVDRTSTLEEHPESQENETNATPNGHAAPRLADVNDNRQRQVSSYRTYSGDFRISDGTYKSTTDCPLGDALRVHHGRQPDSTLGSAFFPTRRASGGSSIPPSSQYATTTTHGPYGPHAAHYAPSSVHWHRNSHAGGTSPPEGGLFCLIRRPQPHAYSLHASRVSTVGQVPSGGAPTRSLRVVAPHHNGGSRDAAANTAATVRPSPGAFIRYILAPMMLVPAAWPWLLLRMAQTLLTVACLLAGAVADGIILAADLLRRHRGGADVLASWAAAWLAWLVTRYWVGLAQLHAGCEEALGRLFQLLTPLLAAALNRSPTAARLARFLSPVAGAAAKAQAAVYGMYFFLHDEIVPVALDLAERLPVVHGLLHRAVVGSRL